MSNISLDCLAKKGRSNIVAATIVAVGLICSGLIVKGVELPDFHLPSATSWSMRSQFETQMIAHLQAAPQDRYSYKNLKVSSVDFDFQRGVYHVGYTIEWTLTGTAHPAYLGGFCDLKRAKEGYVGEVLTGYEGQTLTVTTK